MKLNNNGFSFVEVLAVIAILGILSSAAIIGVSRYKNEAVNKDYEALAKSSYNAMEEYIMANPYEKEVNLRELEENKFLSNRKDPASKTLNCEGAVVYESKSGTAGSMDEGKYTVYLCCPSHKKKYTFPGGKVENITDDTYCDVSSEPDTPEPPEPPTPEPPEPPTPPGPTTVTCSAGKYLPKNSASCATCTSGNYCKGGTWATSTTIDQGLTPCPTGYKNSPAGSTKVEQCYMIVTAGNYVKNKKDTSVTSCGKGTYKVSHNVNYNSTSSCSNCPTGYKDGAGTTSEDNCYMKVPENKYVKTAKASTPTACPSGQLKDPHNVYYGKISSCGSKTITVTFDCNGGTRTGSATSTYKSDVTGQKFTTTCTKTGYDQDGWKRDKNGTSSNYTTNSNVTENFVLTYSPSLKIYAHWDIKTINCSAGNYLKKNATSCTKCEANYYCPGGKFSYSTTKDQGLNPCPSGYGNSAAGSDAANDCYIKVPENKYIKTAKETSATACPSGQYKAAHNVYYGKVSSCSSKSITVTFDCNGGTRSGPATSTYYSDRTGQKFSTTCTRDGYTQDGWKRDKNGTSSNYTTNSNVTENFVLTYSPSLKIYAHWDIKTINCSAGNYLKKNATSCTKCEANYYCPGGKFSYSTTKDQGLNPCPSGYGNSAAGSDAANDCYIKVPENKYIKTAKETSATACPSGQYKAAHNVYYGKVSSCSSKSITVTFDCNGGTRSGPATSTYYSDVTGQKFTTTCTKTGYDQDGWKRDKNGTSSNYTTNSNVTENFVLTYSPSLKIYAHWDIKTINCSAGNYLKKNATSCTKCEANYYCPGGTFTYSTTKDQGKNNCDEKTSGYNKSPAGSSSISNCYISVTAGNYIKTKNNSAQTKCSSGSYRTSHTVNYGNTSSCSSCPTGYGNSAVGSDAATDCYMKVSKNHYVKTKKATSATSCATNYFSDAHNVYYDSTSSCSIGALLKLQADAPAVSSVKIDSGTAGTSASKYVKKGSEVTITATTKNYYQFSSWKSSNTVISSDKSAVIKVNSNMTVTAYGRANVLKLSYYSNGGHLAPSPGTYCPQTAGCTGSICNKTVDYPGCKNKSGLVFQTSGTYDNIHLAATGVFDYKGYESAGLYMEKSGATAKGKWAVGSSTGSVKINQDTTYNTFAAFANACGGSYGSDFKKKDINISLYAQW